MADEKQDAPRPFDVTTVEYLLALMTKHDLSEVDLKEGDQRIRLRKGGSYPMNFAPPVAYQPAHHASAPTSPPAAPQASTTPPAPAKKYHDIISELPGTFYAKPAPDKPAFVSIGTKVKADTTVCYVTAMKVNNEIKAGVSGTIVEVVAENDKFVDYGTVLFRVEPS